MDTTTMTTTKVTLLFTDLVGSTRLLDRLGDEADQSRSSLTAPSGRCPSRA